jgi:hypothetical protein
MRPGRYWMRLSRFFMMTASWRGVLQEPRLPRLLFMFAQAPFPFWLPRRLGLGAFRASDH